MHIDVARNATDDFNLFHDPKKWLKINRNPFKGPIVLGFQLESLIEHKILLHRETHKEIEIIEKHKLRFSNYQFTFANAVKPGQQVQVDIKNSQLSTAPGVILSNRVSIKSAGKLALMGYKKESQYPLFLSDAETLHFGELRHHPDRSFLSDSDFFFKRKFMNTSNAKNFLCGSLADQTVYFDELNDKADFPEIFPCSLISCALLEKAANEKHDFERNPMVYTSHKISIDRNYLAQLKSNDALHILVKRIQLDSTNSEFTDTISEPHSYECYGLIQDNFILYRAMISLTPLENILGALGSDM